MTASKSSRARNARNGAPNARNGAQASAARNGSVGRAGNPARNGSTTTAATAVKNGTAASVGKNGAVGRNGGAGRGGARERALQVNVSDRTAGTGPALWLQLTTFALALVGLGVSIYLTIAHFTESALLGCSESGLVNCTKVTTSAQSYVFGIPVAVLGLAFFVFAVAIMSPWAWRASRREIHLLRIASVLVGIGFVLYLLYAELFIIGNICLYCTSVHIITFVLFVLTMAAVAIWGLKPGAPWTLRLGRAAADTEAPATA
jgi:uncharacterized membrane protein